MSSELVKMYNYNIVDQNKKRKVSSLSGYINRFEEIITNHYSSRLSLKVKDDSKITQDKYTKTTTENNPQKDNYVLSGASYHKTNHRVSVVQRGALDITFTKPEYEKARMKVGLPETEVPEEKFSMKILNLYPIRDIDTGKRIDPFNGEHIVKYDIGTKHNYISGPRVTYIEEGAKKVTIGPIHKERHLVDPALYDRKKSEQDNNPYKDDECHSEKCFGDSYSYHEGDSHSVHQGKHVEICHGDKKTIVHGGDFKAQFSTAGLLRTVNQPSSIKGNIFSKNSHEIKKSLEEELKKEGIQEDDLSDEFIEQQGLEFLTGYLEENLLSYEQKIGQLESNIDEKLETIEGNYSLFADSVTEVVNTSKVTNSNSCVNMSNDLHFESAHIHMTDYLVDMQAANVMSMCGLSPIAIFGPDMLQLTGGMVNLHGGLINQQEGFRNTINGRVNNIKGNISMIGGTGGLCILDTKTENKVLDEKGKFNGKDPFGSNKLSSKLTRTGLDKKRVKDVYTRLGAKNSQITSATSYSYKGATAAAVSGGLLAGATQGAALYGINRGIEKSLTDKHEKDSDKLTAVAKALRAEVKEDNSDEDKPLFDEQGNPIYVQLDESLQDDTTDYSVSDE